MDVLQFINNFKIFFDIFFLNIFAFFFQLFLCFYLNYLITRILGGGEC